jgi:tungstate transport system permease protein
VRLLWEELKAAVPLIFHGNPYLLSVIGFTVEVAVLATLIAVAIGLPIGLAIGLGRFRGRRALQVLANASLGLPPVIVGLGLFLLFVPQGPLGSLHLQLTKRAVIVAQTILALPYIVALCAAAIQGLPAGLLAQARVLGAGRRQLGVLALREARIGVLAAVIAALGTTLSEVGAVVIVGGNVYGFDQTLASAALFEANAAHYADAVAIGIVLIGLILVLMGGVGLLQQRGSGIHLRFRSAQATTPPGEPGR